MAAYLIRRLIEAVPLLLVITLVLFFIIQMTGDPLAAYTVDSTLTGTDIARLRAQYGLDQPVPIQYVRWLGNMLTGNWGTSFVTRQPVLDLLTQRLPNTLILVAASYTIILVVSIGVIVCCAMCAAAISFAVAW